MNRFPTTPDTRPDRQRLCVVGRVGTALLAASLVTGSIAVLSPARAEEPKKAKTDDAKAKVKKAKKAEAKVAPRKKADEDEAPHVPIVLKKTITKPTLTPAELDRLVDGFLAESKAPTASRTTDVEFVRRLYLDLTGKLPTPEQARAFVNSTEKGRRAKLIEYLLNSPDYATNWARYWRDVIRYHATNQNLGRIGLPEFETWMADQITKNRPWDEVAAELIAGTGRVDENGATAFTLAHDGQAVELAGEVSRIFLGVQIQCAQCHDHPNDSWKREQFHEFASFFAGSRVRQAVKGGMGQPPVFEVVGQRNLKYTMPDLKDPQKQIPVDPKFFLASTTTPKALAGNTSSRDRHRAAAELITAQDNPWFAKAYVNRVWFALMGEGFYSPVDDMGPQRTAKAPEVLDALASQWQKGGYDVRWLMRTILNSETYQREVRSSFSASGRTPFASNCPSRLRSDQILDSLAQVLNLPIDGRNAEKEPQAKGTEQGKGQTKAQAKAAGKNSLAADVKDAAGATKGAAALARRFGARFGFNTLFGVDPSVPSDDILGTIPQALFLMNGPQVNRAIEARNGTVLGDLLTAYPDNRVALNQLYVRVLAREPTAKEVQTIGRYIDTVGNRKEAFEDILWSLINSTEFITRR